MPPLCRIAPLIATMILLSSFPAGAKPARVTPGGGELIVDMQGAVAGTMNGQAARFLLSPNGSKVPVLNPAAATRAGLKPGWINIMAIVGPVRVKGHSAVIRYTAPGTALKRRIGWFERNAAPGFDALLGPGAVSAPIVTFRLRATSAGERQFRLPLVDGGYGGMGSAVMIGKHRVLLRWAFDRAETTANAKTGQILSEARSGRWTSRTSELPVAFGISRPHREMALGTPVSVGPFHIPTVMIRTTGTEDAPTDPDEIIVTASKKKQKGPGAIVFGRDALAACSTLTFDKVRKEVRLSCL